MARSVVVTAVARDSLGGVSAPKSGEVVINDPPVIDAIEVIPAQVPAGGRALIRILAHDPEGDALTYDLPQVSAGTVAPTAVPNEFLYTAPSA